MSLIADVRRTLNARACFALVDLAYALRDGRIQPADLPGQGGDLTVADVQAGHDCIMIAAIDRRGLDDEVRACVVPLVRLAMTRRDNDPDAVLVADLNGRPLLTVRHLDMAREACEPMSDARAQALHRGFNTPYGLRARAQHLDPRRAPGSG